jgi:hypothetical protein
MSGSTIRYYCYPRTSLPPAFADEVVSAFRANESTIATEDLEDGLKSDEVLGAVRPALGDLGFDVETGKAKTDKIHRPVLFGKNAEPELRYEVDAYHDEWNCGLEVEAGRAWKGNAIYRDLIQAAMMVRVDTLALAVPNVYNYSRGENPAFDKTNAVVETLFTATRLDLPYDLILIGY